MNKCFFWGILLSAFLLASCGAKKESNNEDTNNLDTSSVNEDNGGDSGDDSDTSDNNPAPICEPLSSETISCTNQINHALSATLTQSCSNDGMSLTNSECQLITCEDGFDISGNSCVAVQASPTMQARFLSYIGGSEFERIQGTFIDDAGYIYVVGTTMSDDFPTTPGAYQENKPSPVGTTLEESDTFIAKLMPDGQSIVWATYLGASRRESAYGVRVDSMGNVYVSGTTGSPDFPTTDGTTNKGPFRTNNLADIFVAKFDATGTLLFSTLVGGAQGREENPRGSILIDENNKRIYISGMTSAPDFPTSPANTVVQSTYGGGDHDGFIFAMADDGSQIIASTFIGGRGADMAFTSLAQHSDGSIIVGGATNSDDFPVTPGAYQTRFAGAMPNQSHWEQGGDAFAMRISPDLDQLIYSTYLGGSGTDTVCHNQGVSINSQNQGVFYINVQSSDFPTTTGNQNRAGNSDTAVVVLAEDGSTIVHSTLVGGNGSDYASGMKVGADDRIYYLGRSKGYCFLFKEGFNQFFVSLNAF